MRVEVSYTDLQNKAESVNSTAITIANLNDLPTGAITISGTGQEDSELSVDTSTLSDNDGLPASSTYSYQWQMKDSSGKWNNIAGATASTFTPGDAQAGQEVRVEVSYTDQQNTAESVNSTAITIANLNDVPTGSISIVGTAQEDSELSIDTSALADNDGLPNSGTYSYQWQMKDSSGKWNNITGATDSTFTPGSVQASQEVRVQLSYTDLQGTTESLDSAAVTVANVNDTPTGTITISGTAQEDSELSVDTSALADVDGLPDSSTYSYQWQVKDSSDKWNNITGATASTFTPSDAQTGKEVRVQMNYTDRQGTTESVTSEAVTIANVNDLPTGLIAISRNGVDPLTGLTAISSTPEPGSVFSIDASTLADADGLPDSTTYRYQWQVKENSVWSDIADATESTFTPTSAYAGKEVRVQIDYTDLQGTAESVISEAAVVSKNDIELRPDSNEVAIASFGLEDNTLMLQLENSTFEGVSSLRILGSDAQGSSPQLLTSLTLLGSGKLDSFKPTFTLDSDMLEAGDRLQFEIVQDGITYISTPTRTEDGEILLNFENGTAFSLTFANDTDTPDLILGDADTIDLTGMTGETQLAFTIYRESAYDNLVGFYTMDAADGSITDDMGITLRPGDEGYKEAALARQLDTTLTGKNGEVTTFTADFMGGGFLGTFLVADGGNSMTNDVYFSHFGSNGNGNDHAKLLGNNTIGFEDQAGLGDRDFNDIVIKIDTVTI